MVPAGVIAARLSTGIAGAGGPGGVVEDPDDVYGAVGTGVFDGALAGFSATGATSDEASARVIGECERAGGQHCTSDEVPSDALCIVSVADDARPTCRDSGVKTVCETSGSVSIKARPGTVAPPANRPVIPWLGAPGARR